MNKEQLILKNNLKQKIAFAFLIGTVTTGLVSFTTLFVNLGFTGAFLINWLRSWALAWLIAVPVILIIAPPIERFVRFLFQERVAFDEHKESFSILEKD